MDLPKRKPNRLKNYDYCQNGAYFVTICTKDRHEMLWNVGADITRPQEPPSLSEHGKIVQTAIDNVSSHYGNVIVDKYCIKPDHVHMIILILPDENGRMISAPTLSVIIGSMKRWVSKQIGFSFWQKSFNDRIIRNEQGYQEVWQYIHTNPLKLEEDCFCENKTSGRQRP